MAGPLVICWCVLVAADQGVMKYGEDLFADYVSNPLF